jgi:hypothetical protein
MAASFGINAERSPPFTVSNVIEERFFVRDRYEHSKTWLVALIRRASEGAGRMSMEQRRSTL